VRIKVEACGICHSDALVMGGTYPGLQYPRIPGHEIAGVIDALGSDVKGWSHGQRVGVGWNGGNCGYCDACRVGTAANPGSPILSGAGTWSGRTLTEHLLDPLDPRHA